MRKLILLSLLTLFSGCVLTKEERRDRRANRKLEKLTNKYPNLVTKDTLIDTVKIEIPEIRIDSSIQINQNTSGVDSILNTFNDKIDSLTKIKLGNEIKYYITNKTVLEDTIIHREDGITVSIWQEGNLIRFKVDKNRQEFKKVVTNVVDKVTAIEIPWYKTLLSRVNKFAIPLAITIWLIWLLTKVVKKLFL